MILHYAGEYVNKYIEENKLQKSLVWLEEQLGVKFPDSQIDMDVEHDPYWNELSLRVWGNDSVASFDLKMHSLFEDMLKLGYHQLYYILSMHQKRF